MSKFRQYEGVISAPFYLFILPNGNEYDLFALPYRQIANKLYAVLSNFNKL